MSETMDSAQSKIERRSMCLNVKELWIKCSSILKKVFTLFVTYFGLLIMVILCLAAGASIFEFLEKDNEVQECFDTFKDYHQMELMTLESLKTVIYSSNPVGDWSKPQIVGILETFRDNVLQIKYDGRDCSMYGRLGGLQYKWSWLGSLLFTVTIVTSIGYGHIAPKTIWGRIVCIAYAMIGIPLTMIFLSAIGNTLATTCRFMYTQLIHCGCCKWKIKKPGKKKLARIKSNQALSGSASQAVMVPNIQFAMPTDSLHYRMHTKKHDLVDGKPNISTSPTSINVSESSNHDPVSILDEIKQTQVTACVHPKNVKLMIQEDKNAIRKIVQHQQSLIADDNDSDLEEKDIVEEPRQGVPLTVVIIIMIFYIVLGAIIFGIWRNWDMLQASYFCFISLSTIGFGDLVPGTDFTLPTSHTELIFGSVYLIFGLALISMCFALMQEEFVAKMKSIGRICGVVQNDEE